AGCGSRSRGSPEAGRPAGRRGRGSAHARPSRRAAPLLRRAPGPSWVGASTSPSSRSTMKIVGHPVEEAAMATSESAARGTVDASPPLPDAPGFEFEPRWNAAPMQWLPVVRQRSNGERVIHRLRWGLVPSWAKDETIATRLINARGESVSDKPSFRAAFRRRRCIVPANGFFEWQQRGDQQGGGKQPFYIHPVGDEF